MIEVKRTALITRTDTAKRQVFGEVGVPLPLFEPDHVLTRAEYETLKAEGRIHYDNGAFLAPDLEEMAHRYLRHSRLIDQEHDNKPGLGDPIESYIALADGEGYRQGGWVLGTHIVDDTAWSRTEAGEYSAYSVSMMAIPLEVPIFIEEPADAGVVVREKTVITYFTDPEPLMVTLCGREHNPATGIGWQVVRCDTTSERVEPTTTKERAVKENEGLLRRILRSLAPIAKDSDLDLKDLLVERTADFATAWAVKKNREDLWDAHYTLQDVLAGIQGDEDIADKTAAMNAAVDQYAAFLKGQVAIIAIARAEDIKAKPALKALSVERALPGVVAAVVERVGKKFSKASAETMQAALDKLTAAAAELQGLMDNAEAGEAIEETAASKKNCTQGADAPASEDAEMDEKTKALIDELKAQNAALVDRVAKLEQPEEPVVEPEADETAKAIEALRTQNETLQARLDTLEKRRPAPKAGGDAENVARTEPKPMFRNLFRSQLGMPLVEDETD